MKGNLILEYIKTLGTTKFILATSGVAISLASFSAGENIGYDRGRLSSGNESRYEMSLEKSNGGMMLRKGFDPHGVAGKILNISDDKIIVADRDGLEKVVAVGTSTIYRQARQNIDLQNLSAGDFVVVLGTPDKTTGSEIDAKLIRLMPTSTPDGAPIVPWVDSRHRGVERKKENVEERIDKMDKIEGVDNKQTEEIKRSDDNVSEVTEIRADDGSNRQRGKQNNK